MRLVLVIVLLAATTRAWAEPRCADLSASWEKLDQRQKDRLPNADYWLEQRPAMWKDLETRRLKVCCEKSRPQLTVSHEPKSSIVTVSVSAS